ncbi:MAG TPA: alpha-hydroxy acid oxidase [Burkholderiales bacterium]|nr:alpha-hydroxy acid oxidase [Burkholderiales bacterium]
MTVACIEDLRRIARRRLPRAIFDFVDGGAQDELTLHANRTDFQRVALAPRVLTDVSQRDASITLLGREIALPLVIAPTGLAGLLWRKGELALARAAEQAGIPYCLSQMAACAIEEVARASTVPFWFQTYLLKDRGINEALMQRAGRAGCQVLVVTVDTKAQGSRDRDVRNGFTVPPRPTLRNLLDMAWRLHWLRGVALGPRVTFANLADSLVGGDDIISLARFAAEQYDFSVDWSDIDWCRTRWRGKLAIKGVLTPQDARQAVEHGADALIVSNHGGRQVDGVPSALAALPAVVDAVQGRAEVILDGGVRRGGDVLKALALGARACMAGRPFLYGLAAAGERGVSQAIGLFAGEIDNNLALLGRPSARTLDRTALRWPR